MNELENVFEIRTVPCKFGVEATQEIGYEIKKIGAKKVLILCGQTIRKQTDIIDKVKNLIGKEKVDVKIWDEVEPAPSISSIEKAMTFVKENEFDCFVGIGGGSTIAASKIIDLYSSYPTNFYDFIPPPYGNGKRITGKMKPLILIPTTAGTGSEASEVAAIDFRDKSGKRERVTISSEYLLANLTILDPLNTILMPPPLTASTGLDALLISISTYTAKPYHTKMKPSTSEEKSTYLGSNPFSDILAEKSIELISKYIRRSYANGNDLEARTHMLFAAHLAGLAAGRTGVHIAHAMAYSIGEKIHADAGMRVAITSPACLDFVAPFVPERINRIAQLLRDERGIPENRIELNSSEALRKLLKDLNCPNGLRGLGLDEKDIPNLSAKAIKQKRLLAQSPIFVTKEDIEEIFKKSLNCW